MEIKILDIDAKLLSEKILALGAKKVFDADRKITYFKNPDKPNDLATFKLTEEEKLKFTGRATSPGSEEIKVFVSCKKEFMDVLALMNYFPVTEALAQRISFELDTIDFDIDIFPGIPPFLELDVPDNSALAREEIISKLGLQGNRFVELSTPQVFALYGKDYFGEFALK